MGDTDFSLDDLQEPLKSDLKSLQQGVPRCQNPGPVSIARSAIQPATETTTPLSGTARGAQPMPQLQNLAASGGSGPCSAHNYNIGSTGTAVSCQNALNLKVDGTSPVTAANFVGKPNYNDNCMSCVRVSNSAADEPDVTMRVIDLKGDPGLDLNLDYIYAKWPSLKQAGNVDCSREFVSDNECTWPAA